MRRTISILFLAAIALLSAACSGGKQPIETIQSATPPSPIPSQTSVPLKFPQRQMTAAFIEGSVEYRQTADSNWETLQVKQTISEGASLRTGIASYVHIVMNDNSSLIAGPQTVIAIDQFSPTFENPRTILNLQEGGVLIVAAESAMGSGTFAVKTVCVIAALTGKQTGYHSKGRGLSMPAQFPGAGVIAMTVTIVQGSQPGNVATQVGMLSGNGTISFPGGRSSQLDLSQYVQIEIGSDESQPIPPELQAEARLLGIYDLRRLIAILTGIPATATASLTPQPTNTVTTFTPFKLSDQPTTTLTPNPRAAHQQFTPDPNWTPRPDGLTSEESANAGTHDYNHSCQAFADCICSDEMNYTLGTIAFSNNNVTLSATAADGGGSISYNKVSPNVYSLDQDGLTAKIIFFIDGWDFVVTKNGGSCSYQTFLLR